MENRRRKRGNPFGHQKSHETECIAWTSSKYDCERVKQGFVLKAKNMVHVQFFLYTQGQRTLCLCLYMSKTASVLHVSISLFSSYRDAQTTCKTPFAEVSLFPFKTSLHLRVNWDQKHLKQCAISWVASPSGKPVNMFDQEHCLMYTRF